VQTVKNNPSRIREVNQEVEQLGATVKAQWATLGHFDFINIVEAPDDETMATFALLGGMSGSFTIQTMRAFNEAEADQLIRSLKAVDAPPEGAP
jgi:uncharacterized protein with GYD domain